MNHVDMLRVEVTAEDIKRGRRRSTARCPVARAIRRARKEAGLPRKPVRVCSAGDTPNTTHLHLERGRWGDEIPLPPVVDQFVHTFDAHGAKAVQPFAFWLPVD